MGFADYYFTRYKTEEQIIPEKPSANLGLIITIPCFKEYDTIIKALESLYYCVPSEKDAEVIVLINYPDNRRDNYKSKHEETYSLLQSWSKVNSKPKLKFHILIKELPSKTAGVGYARRVAMDEALLRFNTINNSNGIITGFDADCTCDSNYLSETEKLFLDYPKTTGCSIYFEHPLEGTDFTKENYNAIIQYELYLRYYVEALRLAGFPYAFHTIGSSFAVRADIYAQQGGMNKRQAGEDFYFLHKIIPLGNYRELNSTRVIPSPRESDRVVFGTGAAISKLLKKDSTILLTYNPVLFSNLKELFNKLDFLFNKVSTYEEIIGNLDATIAEFLKTNNFFKKIEEINNNATSIETFKKRFFVWFNGLMVFQYLNSYKDQYDSTNIAEAAAFILKKKGIELSGSNAFELLEVFRNIQKKSYWLLP